MRADFSHLVTCFKILAMAATISLPTIAQADFTLFPAIFEVMGVSDNDTLNVRLAPKADAEDIGDLYPNTQVEVTAFDATEKWARIVWQGMDGWISRRYLQEAPQYGDDFSGMPVDLSCHGTEPFWYGDITAQGHFNFTKIGAEVETSVIESSVMSNNFLRANYAFETSKYTGFLRRSSCSDGMSDATYGWALDILSKDANAPYLRSGCCTWKAPEGDY